MVSQVLPGEEPLINPALEPLLDASRNLVNSMTDVCINLDVKYGRDIYFTILSLTIKNKYLEKREFSLSSPKTVKADSRKLPEVLRAGAEPRACLCLPLGPSVQKVFIRLECVPDMRSHESSKSL